MNSYRHMDKHTLLQKIESMNISPDIKLSLFDYIGVETDTERINELLVVVREYQDILERQELETEKKIKSILLDSRAQEQNMASLLRKDLHKIRQDMHKTKDKNKMLKVLKSIADAA